MNITEAVYEGSVLEVIQDLGYEYISAEDIKRESYKNPLFMDDLYDALARINNDLPLKVIERAIFQIENIDMGTLPQRNRHFTEWLQNGMEVSYREDNQDKTSIVQLIDYEEIDNNSFVVTNQWTVAGENQNRRPDILTFVNGLPLVVIELKSASSESADVSSAYRQIRNYQLDIPELFVYNAFNIISDHTHSKAGTITSTEEWYKEWKTIDGSYEDTRFAAYDVLFKGMLERSRLLDIIRNFIVYENNTPGDIKILAQYHQYYAVRKAVASTLKAKADDGRAGVFWHTQGSGKSLSMVFYTQLLLQYLESPTFVILTDRNDLDEQLYGQFSRVQTFLRQTPQRAETRIHLRELLEGRKANGLFFTTMQKFAEADDSLTERDDIIVMADEAHRSQYGLRESIKKDGSVHVGMARIIRNSLPNANYIGFTGTPVSTQDKDTQEVFGEYIDVYDMTQAVEDGATKPIYYESRVVNIGLDNNLLEEIDATYEVLRRDASDEDISKSQSQFSRLEAILSNEQVIDTLTRDIIEHYEQERAHLLTGKAMIVAYNREIAMLVYKKLLELRPNWQDKVEVVMTSSNNDPEEWKQIIGNEAHKKELGVRFKDNDDPMKIAIVVDMWLTGFDVPSLATMYVFKPMKDHNLMQAIARVNRVFEDKEGGLIVDYIGIAKALKDAMSDYTVRDKENFSNPDIRDEIYPLFQEKLEVCQSEFLSALAYQDIIHPQISDRRRADLITEGINHIYKLSENLQNDFKDEAYILKQSHSLCSSISTPTEQRLAAYIEAIRIGVNRIVQSGQLSLLEINEQISRLLEQSIQTEGVINLFSDVDAEFSIFDPEFLDNIRNMEQKNLAIELMNKLLEEEVKAFARTNLVKAEEFSKKIKAVMDRYRQSLIDNAKALDEFNKLFGKDNPDLIIDLLIDLANEIVESDQLGESLGLTEEETSFYYALTLPESITDHYADETLIEMAKELTRVLKENETVDWQFKKSGKARMRTAVRRLLRKYDYPPEEIRQAMEVVLKQCENWTGRNEVV